MNLPFIIAAVLIPVAIGGVIFFLVFRRVNRRYLDMFVRLTDVARSNPSNLRGLLSGPPGEQDRMIGTIATLEKIHRVEIARAGRTRTSLYLHAYTKTDPSMTGKPEVFDVVLQLEDQWKIRRFAPL